MDVFIPDPPKYCEKEAPYLTSHQINELERTNQHNLQKNEAQDYSYHLPFTSYEEEKILTYCSIQKFRDQFLPQQMIPYRLLYDKDLKRNYQSIMNYMSDLVTYKTTTFENNVNLTKSKIKLLVYSTEIDVKQVVDEFKVDTINANYFVIFSNNMLPVVCKYMSIDKRNLFLDRPFPGLNKFMFCSNNNNACCLYLDDIFYIYDIDVRIICKSNFGKKIPTFGNWRIPVERNLSLVKGYKYFDIDKSTFLIAAFLNKDECVGIWECNLETKEYKRYTIKISPLEIQWFEGKKLGIVDKKTNCIYFYSELNSPEPECLKYEIKLPYTLFTSDGNSFIIRFLKDMKEYVKIYQSSKIHPINVNVQQCNIIQASYCNDNFMYVIYDDNSFKSIIYIWNKEVQHKYCGTYENKCLKLIALPSLSYFVAIWANTIRVFDNFGNLIDDKSFEQFLCFDEFNFCSIFQKQKKSANGTVYRFLTIHYEPE